MRSPISLALLATALLATACDKKEPPKPKEVIRPVRFVTVALDEGTRERVFAGQSKAGLESRLSFKVAGTVVELDAKVGDTVEEGQILAQIDPKDYDLQVQEARAAIAQASAQARNAKAQYNRVRQLYENRSASRADLDAARAAKDSAAASVTSLRQRLKLLKSQKGYTSLEAPTKGRISQVAVEKNENVQAGQPIVVLVAQGSNPEVTVGVPEVLIGKVKKGMPVGVRFDAIEGETLDATVTEIGEASQGSTFAVTASLDKNDPRVRQNMAAEVVFVFEQGEGPRIVVPPVSVGSEGKDRYVYLVDREGQTSLGKVRRQAVETGELTGEGLVVKQGLSAGDMLVTAGVSRIKPGQQVRLPQVVAREEPGAKALDDAPHEVPHEAPQ